MVFSQKKLKELEKRHIESVAELCAILYFSQNHGGGTRREGFMPDSHSLAPEVPSLDANSRLTQFLQEDAKKTRLSISPSASIGTAGFDLRVGKFIAWTDTVAQDIAGKDLKQLPHKFLEEGEEFVLESDPDGNKVYYILSHEQISHSPDLEILIDSKSTSGRVGCMSCCAGATKKGERVTVIQPYAFPLKVTCGKTSLAQAVVRFRDTPYMNSDEVKESKQVDLKGDNTSLENSLTPKGLLMKFNTALVYRAKKNNTPIDMDARASVDWRDYFELIEGNSRIRLDNKTLYLLGSLGIVSLKRVCGLLSREQDVLTGTGTWGHMAGVIQPFFQGSITMEVYSHSNRLIKKGDKAGVVIFDKVEGETDKESYGGSYQGQKSPTLPKMFKI